MGKSSVHDQLIPGLFLFAFLGVGFLPNLGAADRIAPQWLYLAGVNLLAGIYLLSRKTDAVSPSLLRSGVSICWIGFLLWAACSCLFAINPTEVVVNLTRQVIAFLAFLFLAVFVLRLREERRLVATVIVLVMGVEVFSILIQALDMILAGEGISPYLLRGVTANRNVAAFSIAIKLPFAWYLLFSPAALRYRIFLILLVVSSVLALVLISSRSAFLALGMTVVVLGAFYPVDRERKSVFEKGWVRFLGILLPLGIAVAVYEGFLAGHRKTGLFERIASMAHEADNLRFRFFGQAWDQWLSRPLTGVGFGNWKIASIHHDREHIVGYNIPYHVHNDFLQTGAELGFIGFVCYAGIFLVAAVVLIRLIRNREVSVERRRFGLVLLTGLGVYLIDANLNFPMARPQAVMPLALLLGLGWVQGHVRGGGVPAGRWGSLRRPVSGALLLLGIPALWISIQVYRSHRIQPVLDRDMRLETFSLSRGQVERDIPRIPNLSVTAFPMDAIRARYFIHFGELDRALELLEKSVRANPYLKYSEVLMSRIWLEKGDLDEARRHAEIAFRGLPGNQRHAANYVDVLIRQKDLRGLDAAFESLTGNGGVYNWYNYLLGVSKLSEPGNPKYIERADQAMRLFPRDRRFVRLHELISRGASSPEP